MYQSRFKAHWQDHYLGAYQGHNCSLKITAVDRCYLSMCNAHRITVNVVVQVTMHHVTVMSTITYSSASFGLFCLKTQICGGNSLPQLKMQNFPHENVTPTTTHDISCHYALTVPSSCISLSVTSMTSSIESLTGLFVAMGSCGNDTSSK